jgi:hypothetical protein
MAPNKQVSSVIRISQGERDASARATHLEAATGKFLVTTNERKQMSTKTNFKRIALVAVAALGLGVLSSVPTQAAPIGTSITVVSNGTAKAISLASTTVNSDSTTAAKLTVTSLMSARTDSVSVTFVQKSIPLGATPTVKMTYLDTGIAGSVGIVGTDTNKAAISVAGNTLGQNVLTDSVAAGSFLWMASSSTSAYASAKFMVAMDSRTTGATHGVYTYTLVATPYTAGTAAAAVTADFTITVSDPFAADKTATGAAGTSTAIMDAGTSWVSGTVDDEVSGSFAPGTVIGVIRLTQLTSAGDPAVESITATTTIGNLGFNSSTAIGKSLSLYQADTDGIDDIYIIGDGTSGTATITLKTTSVTFANKSVNFYSTSVDKYEVTRLVKVLGSASANALVVKAIDAQGNVIKETASNSTVYAYSDTLASISTGGATTTAGTQCTAYSSTAGGHVCALSGAANGTAKITIRNKSTLALSTKASTPVELTVNLNPAAKVALSFDKATYAPGELAYLSVSAVDTAGNPVGPNAGTDYLATGGITSTSAFGNGSAATESFTATTLPFNTATTGRVTDVALYTLKLYMPSTGGTITVSATGGTALPAANQVKVTATATVTDNGAAALAAVNALATTVASLRTLITTLTNLVLKIQKKVKA